MTGMFLAFRIPCHSSVPFVVNSWQIHTSYQDLFGPMAFFVHIICAWFCCALFRSCYIINFYGILITYLLIFLNVNSLALGNIMIASETPSGIWSPGNKTLYIYMFSVFRNHWSDSTKLGKWVTNKLHLIAPTISYISQVYGPHHAAVESIISHASRILSLPLT